MPVAATPGPDAIAWSRDSTRYLALPGSFGEIQKGLNSMPPPAAHRHSTLLMLVPRDTVLYAAIPNLGSSIAEAGRLVQERLGGSAVLREWWEQQQDGPKLHSMVDKLRTFSGYLGDEIVFTISGGRDGNFSPPMMLAEVKKSGLDAFLRNEFGRMGLAGAKATLQVVSIEEPVNGSARANRSPVNGGQEAGPMRIGMKDNLVAVTWNQAQMDDLGTRLARADGELSSDGLLGDVQNSYRNGAGWLLCVDMEQIARHTLDKSSASDGTRIPPGLNSIRHLMVERKDIGGKTENRATVTFNGNRSGVADWIAEPSALRSLDFLSPNATFAVSLTLRRPGCLLGDLLGRVSEQNSKLQANLDKLSRQSGLEMGPALGVPLGPEMTFAFDGPLLPVPSWKLVLEVYNSGALQTAIEQFVTALNNETECANSKVTLARDVQNGRTYYALRSARFTYEINYTYVEGYIVVASSRADLDSAIRNRETGNVLSHSDPFRSQLTVDGKPNFSGLVYHNLRPMLKAAASHINHPLIAKLAESAGPGLIYLNAQPDRIQVASAS